jgi:uncharacterized membrane protein YgcG
MPEEAGLRAEVGITLGKLTRELAQAEARMNRTAKRIEADFRRTASPAVARSFEQVNRATMGLTGSGGLRMLALQLNQVAQQGAVTGQWGRAFSVQLADMALVLGPVGIAIGAVAAALTPFIAGMFEAEEATLAMVDAVAGGAAGLASVRGTIDELRSLQETYTTAIEASAGASSDTAAAVIANSAREFDARKQLLAVELQLLNVRSGKHRAELAGLEVGIRGRAPTETALRTTPPPDARGIGPIPTYLYDIGAIGRTYEPEPGMGGKTGMEVFAEVTADASLRARELRAELELTNLAIKEAGAALNGEFLDVGGGGGGAATAGGGGGGGGGRRGGGGGGSNSTPASEAVKQVGNEIQLVVELADRAQQSLSDTFVSILTGAESAREAVAKLAAEWAKMFLQRGIDALLGPAFSAIFPGTVAASARGNVISAGRVVPFARGGVVDRPTVFPMRSGAGLMGERGPEAILPLRRGGDGKLGVAGGRVRVDISLNNAMLEARTTTTAKGVAVGVLRRYDRAMPQRVSEIARDPRKR